MKPTGVTHFETPADLRTWLERNHGERDALWVGYWKKTTGRLSITWEESVDVALCFGWIDGIRQRIDDEAYTVRFTPRRRGSTWSLRNVERYRLLDADGLVHAAGRAAWERRVEEKTGTYSFEQKKPQSMAGDFMTRLEADRQAHARWEAKPPGYRKRTTHWVMSAKRPETRERRFQSLLEGLRDGTA